MRTDLDVLLLESHPWVADSAAASLEAAGHRLHRCHEPGAVGYACSGLVAGGTCPLDGHVDVAVVVRSGAAAGPTPHEDGVRCALRARVPLVEVGEEAGDPFAAWLTVRADEDDVVGACGRAVELARGPLAAAVVEGAAPTLRSAGIDPSAVRCTFEASWPVMDVHVHVDAPLDRRLEQAVGVRAFDALRAELTSYSTINVAVDGAPVHA